ncbi:MAG: hypothetical protein RMJ56_13010 [Gemmataceae bacterium]|nr:Cna B-type domain-containing protein [Gemmata sp.]MDW8198515.1 hypothetical protein [Gemmataceae bacterium]
MLPVVSRMAAAVVLGSTIMAHPLWADDKPSTDPPAKAPTFPGYVFVADVVGEVVKADEDSITLRVTWYEPQVRGGNNPNRVRPNLNRNNRNFRNPFAPNMNRPNQPQVQWKEKHEDYVLKYLPESLVRFKSLPPKYDENGKKIAYTQKELNDLRQPAGVTGYAASRFDVTPGSVVELILIRDKTIPAEKATEGDLRIKHAIILGRNPNNVPKDEPPKKKN